MRTDLETSELNPDEANPWRTLSTRRIYENSWIKLREDQVQCPDGRPGIYSVIETRIATGVVALTDLNEICLVGQYRYPLQCYSWEIPEGGAEVGEDPFVTIQRELQEEAGVRAARWFQLGSEIHLSNCYSNERAILYFAKELEQVPVAPDHTEVLQIRRVPFTEALSMVVQGKITDAMSVVAILLTSRVLAGEQSLLRGI